MIIIYTKDDELRYSKLASVVRAYDNFQRNNHKNIMINTLKSLGATVKYVGKSSVDERKIINNKCSEDSINSGEQERIAILSVENSSDDRHEILSKIFVEKLTKNQRYILKKKNISIALHVNVEDLTAEDIMAYDYGVPKHIEALMDQRCGVERERLRNLEGRESGIAIIDAERNASRAQLTAMMKRDLKLNKDFNGSYSQERAGRLRKAIREDEIVTAWIEDKLHFQPNSQLSDIAFASKLLRKLFGIKIDSIRKQKDRKMVRIYKINKIVSKTLQKYYKWRYDNFLMKKVDNKPI